MRGEPPHVTVRPATDADSVRIWQWRNDPQTRAASTVTELVRWPDHIVWFRRTLVDVDRHLLIGETDGRPVGVVRFDRTGTDWTVSVNLAPTARGHGLSVPLIDAARSWLFQHDIPSPIVAQIRVTNTASVRLFERAGYRHSAEADGMLTMIYPS